MHWCEERREHRCNGCHVLGHHDSAAIRARKFSVGYAHFAAKKETHEGSFFTPKDSIVFFFSVLNKNCLIYIELM